MSYIGQAPGLGQRSVFRFVALQGQTVFSGRDAAGLVLAYATGTSTLVAVNGRLLSGPDYTATDGSTLTIAAPLSAGDEVIVVSDAPFSPANTYTTDAADARFTRKRNRIVNPGMRISQERGGAAGAFSGYLIDGWQGGTGATSAVTSAQQVAVPTPGGSTHRLRVTVTTGSNDGTYAVIGQRIEGVDIADLRFGTASAKTVMLRLGLKAPAGQYSVQVSNSASNRVFLAPITVTAAEANTDVVRTISIPGDVTGTWAIDNGTGIVIQFAFGSGGGQGVAGWQGGFPLTLAGQTNGLAATGNVFELFDAGLYEGSVLPPFELLSYDQDFQKCQRYFQWMPTLVGNWDTSTRYNGAASFPTPMRVAPTVSFVSSGQGVTRAYVGDYPVSGVFFSETTTTTIITALTTASADPNYVGFTKGNLKVALNARL